MLHRPMPLFLWGIFISRYPCSFSFIGITNQQQIVTKHIFIWDIAQVLRIGCFEVHTDEVKQFNAAGFLTAAWLSVFNLVVIII